MKRLTSKISPNFYLKSPKKTYSDVYALLIHNNQRKKVFMKTSIPTVCWDEASRQACGAKVLKKRGLIVPPELKSKDWEAAISKLNYRIGKVKNESISYNQDTKPDKLNINVLVDRLNQKVFGNIIPDKTLVNNYLEDLIARMKNGQFLINNERKYNPKTIEKFSQLKNAIIYYNPKLTFSDIDYSFGSKFVSFLYNYEKLNVVKSSTAGRYLKDLKTTCEYAFREKTNLNLDFKSIKCPRGKITRIALSEDEILKVIALNLSGKMKLYRDLFIISYHLAFRISDLMSLKPHHLKGNAIEKVMIKGRKFHSKDIDDKALSLLKEYINNMPKVSEPVYNRKIKEIGKLAGINKIIEYSSIEKGIEVIKTEYKYNMITSHTARRSKISNLSRSNLSKPLLMAFSGHSSITSLEKYLDVVY